MTQKPACLYLSEVIPPEPASPWLWAALEPGDNLLHGQDHPESLAGCTGAAPLALCEHPRSCSQALGWASPAPEPRGSNGRCPQPRPGTTASKPRPFLSGAAPEQSSAPVVCTQPWQKGPDSRRRVFCHPHHGQLHHRSRLGL